MALIASSDAPLLLLDGALVVVAASRSFCLAFDLDSDQTAGVDLARLGGGEWAGAQLRSLLNSTAVGLAAVEGYEMAFRQLDRPDRNLVLTVKLLDYDADDVRLLLTATDVTALRAADRAKDVLLREQAVMLKELQHRVANSLQIIA
ncbi:MAG: histidine kinase, partial [Sphingomonadaceae bacterium]|nr:histidine kinase [Sphingomonadaceae bacterium]